MKELTKEQQEVWDRLTHGIPANIRYEFEFECNFDGLNIEEELQKIIANKIRHEIDKQILSDILNLDK